MFGNVGMGEIFLILLVVLLVFGAKRIPEIARGLGRGLREFKDATQEIRRELEIEDPFRTTPSQRRNQGSSIPRSEGQRRQGSVENPSPGPEASTSEPLATEPGPG